ncbi:MAG: hypothetical protein PHQ43_07080 [Dehalococcoidales bacterium]|nr:hypothetical protein [Dehalococcoidales bacterium]
MAIVDEIAEKIRKEPYCLITNNCIHKAFRFRKECLKRGISARVVIAFGCTRVNRSIQLDIPVIHAWAEVEEKRIELAHPLDKPSIWGTLDSQIRPLVAVWI